MLSSLLVAAAVTAPAAPVPKDALPNTTGPAPRVVAVKADAGGTVWITANVYEKQKVQQQFAVTENGKQVIKTQEVEQTVSSHVHKQLADFGGKFALADGTPLGAEDATRRVKGGATLLVTADGKPVDKGWLRAVADDTVIMTAEGLGEAHFVHGYAPYPMTAAPRLAMLGTDDKGQVRLPVNVNGGAGTGRVYYGDINGRFGGRGQIMIQNEVLWVDSSAVTQPSATPAGPDGKKALADLQFDAYDATGKLVSRTAALERLKAGGLVVIAGDNRFPDESYLKAFRGDLLVLASQELVFPPGMPNPYDRAVAKAAAAPPAKAVAPADGIPLRVAPAIQLNPAVIKQVQIQIGK